MLRNLLAHLPIFAILAERDSLCELQEQPKFYTQTPRCLPGQLSLSGKSVNFIHIQIQK